MMYCGFIQKVLLPQCCDITYVTCTVMICLICLHLPLGTLMPVHAHQANHHRSCYIYNMYFHTHLTTLLFNACTTLLCVQITSKFCWSNNIDFDLDGWLNYHEPRQWFIIGIDQEICKNPYYNVRQKPPQKACRGFRKPLKSSLLMPKASNAVL